MERRSFLRWTAARLMGQLADPMFAGVPPLLAMVSTACRTSADSIRGSIRPTSRSPYRIGRT